MEALRQSVGQHPNRRRRGGAERPSPSIRPRMSRSGPPG
jgi:hypothetical protein